MSTNIFKIIELFLHLAQETTIENRAAIILKLLHRRALDPKKDRSFINLQIGRGGALDLNLYFDEFNLRSFTKAHTQINISSPINGYDPQITRGPYQMTNIKKINSTLDALLKLLDEHNKDTDTPRKVSNTELLPRSKNLHNNAPLTGALRKATYPDFLPPNLNSQDSRTYLKNTTTDPLKVPLAIGDVTNFYLECVSESTKQNTPKEQKFIKGGNGSIIASKKKSPKKKKKVLIKPVSVNSRKLSAQKPKESTKKDLELILLGLVESIFAGHAKTPQEEALESKLNEKIKEQKLDVRLFIENRVIFFLNNATQEVIEIEYPS
ncbi:MAG: hypothetical protein OEV93_00820 [Candidatus Moranbacteria bacterium]|nr:hypothetical protein [Candidatus Moranbacteria bacterium]